MSSQNGSQKFSSVSHTYGDLSFYITFKVDNLTYRTTPEDLRRAFDRYGDVGDVYIPRDRFSRESRGTLTFSFVSFVNMFVTFEWDLLTGKSRHQLKKSLLPMLSKIVKKRDEM